MERYRQVARLPEPQRTKVDLHVQLEELAQLMRPELSGAGIALELVLDSLPPVMVDQQLLNQAVINLLKNAQDAVKDIEKPHIRLGVHPGSEGLLSIWVEDNGCGIPEAELNQVWIPFFTTKESGSGVGLSLVRQVAHAHGGIVSIQSTLDKGTVVTMQLAMHQ